MREKCESARLSIFATAEQVIAHYQVLVKWIQRGGVLACLLCFIVACYVLLLCCQVNQASYPVVEGQ